ncbi:MAG TPA: fused MFS/spermidine synthase [Burkholderiales bacterium]|nr:fused MFS/spermidine synthase [Burkholderiales bacterium]
MLYAFTIFVSAFLLFQVQPIIAKMILPWFGGGAAVWTTCMLFFQLLLVGGYLYAHWTTRSLAARTQAVVHAVLLALAAVALPIIPDVAWKPAGETDPGLRILVVLALTVGLPYFMLSTTGPLVQVWYSRANRGAMPYRLYALSNLGSMLALLTYPVAVEPWLPTRAQALGWSGAFVVFAAACGVLAWQSRGATWEATAGAPEASAARPTFGRYVLWAALAATASVLLLAFTSQLSQNVAPMPFIWVLPLALYLLSFILTFDGRGWYRRRYYLPLAAAGLVGVTVLLHSDFRHSPLWVMLPVYAATLFVACMVCHGELVHLKPAPRYLTGFYLAISVGGALGGVFVGLVAPRIFLDLYELPVGLVATAAVVAVVLALDRPGFPRAAGWRAAVSGAVVLAAGLTGSLAWIYSGYARDAEVRMRNFYAAMRVWDTGGGADAQRVLTHGSITHGKQFTGPERRKWITTYYGETSGVGRAILAAGAKGPVRVGVIGLGTGTLAGYGREGDTFRLYEINPQVIDIAMKRFSYVTDTRAHVEMVLGDARLSLEREPSQGFDVLAVDAFSSDSIPVHLLTAEAFETYFRHLKPGGILAVHISNRYLDLKPVLHEAAARFGRHTRLVDEESDDERGVYGSTWVLIANDPLAFEQPPLEGVGEPLAAEKGVRLWTDDYSDLWRILK